jgi:transcriptional regulator with XRE-family HTH domain
MNLTATLIETLKRYLKVKGITYKTLAQEMRLSEASIKRMFSKKTFSLARLEEVCRILDIDFYDLALMDRQKKSKTADTLSIEQEEVLVKDKKLSFFLYFLINGWSVSQIREEYEYSDKEIIRMLRQLERLGLLALYPNDRVRMLIANNVYWQTGGPLGRAYHDMFVGDFLDNPFDRPSDCLLFTPGQFTQASLKIIQKKIDNLVREFNQLAEMDSALPLKSRYSTGLLIGFRPWVFTMIADLRRNQKKKNQ